jgi:hypothetical protein
MGFKYRVYGHCPIYIIKQVRVSTENVDPFAEIKSSNEGIVGGKGNPSIHLSQGGHSKYKSQFYHPPTYQVLNKEMKMSFKESK